MCIIAPELKRRATKPYFLENANGEKVPIKPGDAVWIPAHVLQMDAKYFSDHNKFDPERFSEENQLYAPYGMGPRDCIGCLYATIETKISFYNLLLNFVVDKTNGNKSSNEYEIEIRFRNGDELFQMIRAVD